MNSKQIEGKRLFVLDTNILMHDPTSLFRFKEHDIFLPMIVLEELDNNKKGTTEVARNARQSSRFLDEMMSGVSPEDIEDGLELNVKHQENSIFKQNTSQMNYLIRCQAIRQIIIF